MYKYTYSVLKLSCGSFQDLKGSADTTLDQPVRFRRPRPRRWAILKGRLHWKGEGVPKAVDRMEGRLRDSDSDKGDRGGIRKCTNFADVIQASPPACSMPRRRPSPCQCHPYLFRLSPPPPPSHCRSPTIIIAPAVSRRDKSVGKCVKSNHHLPCCQCTLTNMEI